MSLSHAVVWLDHQEAHVIQFNTDNHENSTVTTKSKHSHVRQKAGMVGSGHVTAGQNYLHEVAEAIAGSSEILIAGSGTGKLKLIKHMNKHDPRAAEKVVGVETVDHRSDGRLLAYAKKYFLRADNMRPQ